MLTKSKLPAEKRLELVHVSLMRQRQFAFFAGLFMVGKTTIEDNPGLTAATDGRNAIYGREFVDTLTDKELAFLVLHENMHKCYRHLTTWRKLYERNHSLANDACDYVINIQLYDMDQHGQFITMPKHKEGPFIGKAIGLLDERFRGMDAKQVFDILEDECEKRRRRGEQEGGNGEGDEISDTLSDSSGGNGLDQHDWEGAKAIPEDEQKKLAQEIEGALRQGGIYAGKVGADMLRSVQEMLEPKVDWREVLQRFVRVSLKDRDQPSWRRAHRNYLWQDVILPSILGKRMKHVVLMLDTSGSIQGELLGLFMGELNKVIESVNPDRVDVLYWDTAVAGHETYTGNDKRDIVHKTKARGGGGTDPDCLPPYVESKGLKPDAFIVLTDGYFRSNPAVWAPIKDKPILWCVIGSRHAEIPCGQIVNVVND